jgi:hypothetical protein
MRDIYQEIRYLSPSQLRALFLLAKSDRGVISSIKESSKIGKKGKSLGAVFSSLVRHKFSGEPLIIPWGKDESGRGLRFKLNEKLISRDKLLAIVKEMLT